MLSPLWIWMIHLIFNADSMQNPLLNISCVGFFYFFVFWKVFSILGWVSIRPVCRLVVKKGADSVDNSFWTCLWRIKSKKSVEAEFMWVKGVLRSNSESQWIFGLWEWSGRRSPHKYLFSSSELFLMNWLSELHGKKLSERWAMEQVEISVIVSPSFCRRFIK